MRSYRIKPGDVLRVRIWTGGQVPEQSLDHTVELNGIIVLPRIGMVEVAGLSIEEAREKIRQAAGSQLTSMTVAIVPLFQVAVMGGVGAPRSLEALPGWSVFDAISAAGGFAPLADTRRVDLIRGARTFQLSADTQEGLMRLTNVAVQSGDRVYVHIRKPFNYTLTTFVLQVATLAVTVFLASRN